MEIEATVVALIEQMATGTISFIGSVVSNLWVWFLSLGVLVGIGGYILHRVGFIGHR